MPGRGPGRVYRVSLTPWARRHMRQLASDAAVRVAEAIDGLALDPRPMGCLLLRNHRPPTWRTRVGDWRVLYQVDDEAGVVTVTGVRHRGQAYRS